MSPVLTSNILFYPRSYWLPEREGGLSAAYGVDDQDRPVLVFIAAETFKKGDARSVIPSFDLFAGTGNRAVAAHPENSKAHVAAGGRGGAILLSRVSSKPERGAELAAQFFVQEQGQELDELRAATPVECGWAVSLRAGVFAGLDARSANKKLAEMATPAVGLGYFDLSWGELRLRRDAAGNVAPVEIPRLLAIPKASLKSVPEDYDHILDLYQDYQAKADGARNAEDAKAAHDAYVALVVALDARKDVRLRYVFVRPEQAIEITAADMRTPQFAVRIGRAIDVGSRDGFNGGALIQGMKEGNIQPSFSLPLVAGIQKQEGDQAKPKPGVQVYADFIRFGGGELLLQAAQAGAIDGVRITPIFTLNFIAGQTTHQQMMQPKAVLKRLTDSHKLSHPSSPLARRPLQYWALRLLRRPKFDGSKVVGADYPLSQPFATLESDLCGLPGFPSNLQALYACVGARAHKPMVRPSDSNARNAPYIPRSVNTLDADSERHLDVGSCGTASRANTEHPASSMPAAPLDGRPALAFDGPLLDF